MLLMKAGGRTVCTPQKVADVMINGSMCAGISYHRSIVEHCVLLPTVLVVHGEHSVHGCVCL